jgi:hypothetical protein
MRLSSLKAAHANLFWSLVQEIRVAHWFLASSKALNSLL